MGLIEKRSVRMLRGGWKAYQFTVDYNSCTFHYTRLNVSILCESRITLVLLLSHYTCSCLVSIPGYIERWSSANII